MESLFKDQLCPSYRTTTVKLINTTTVLQCLDFKKGKKYRQKVDCLGYNNKNGWIFKSLFKKQPCPTYRTTTVKLIKSTLQCFDFKSKGFTKKLIAWATTTEFLNHFLRKQPCPSYRITTVVYGGLDSIISFFNGYWFPISLRWVFILLLSKTLKPTCLRQHRQVFLINSPPDSATFFKIFWAQV